jgi:rod shape-determining protein MreB and related proteins
MTFKNQIVVMGYFSLYGKRSFGIDLGNTNTIVNNGENILLSQPSYIAFHKQNLNVKAVGEEAYDMFEKTHADLKSVKPLKCGVIADFNSARCMIAEMVKGVYEERSFLDSYDNVISGVPFNTSSVERRALREALDQFKARNTYLISEPIAAAIGMDLNIQEPDGKLIIDIGGGVTEIVVISLSGIATFQSLKTAGDSFDTEIQDAFRRNYNMSIGIKTAEQIKIKVGAVSNDIISSPMPFDVRGKDLASGLPINRKVDHLEIARILDKHIVSIEEAIINTLESCPPELAADIYKNGLIVTGGGAHLRGLKERLQRKIKLPVHVDINALTSVSKGLAKILRDVKKYRTVLVS